jgi:hypothetical protein
MRARFVECSNPALRLGVHRWVIRDLGTDCSKRHQRNLPVGP